MARVRCNACLGEYDQVGKDGVPYFHACPPLVIVTVIDQNNQRSELQLGTDHGKVIVENVADVAETAKAGIDPQIIVVEQSRREQLRDGHRDENPVPGTLEPGMKRPIVAKGAGVTVIAA